MTGPRILVVDDNPELLTLLSSSFEEAGYAVQTATRGRTALDLARKDRPDLVIVDVLLPDLMGFDVAEALRRLRIPFVFMSGVHKGGKAASGAVEKYGALGYFEKPFERRQLLELVGRTVPNKPVPAAPAFDVESAPQVDEAAEAMQLTGRIDIQSGGVGASIKGERVDLKSQVLPPAPAQPAAIDRLQVARVRPAVSAPPPPVMKPLSSTPPPPPAEAFESRPEPAQAQPAELQQMKAAPEQRVRRGELKDNFPQLLAAFHAARETGELGLQRGNVKKIVYFESGMPVFALSNLVADRLGQFLVRAGKIDAETLNQAAEEAETTRQRTGDVLILMGVLTEQERLYYIGQQIKSILYSLFAWEDGSYYLSFQNRARKEAIKLDVHPANLILRGVKKLYRLERLQRLLPDTAKLVPSQDPFFQLSDVELQPWEAHLLPKCDGTRTVRELVASSGRPVNEALATLVGLQSMRIVEQR